jgi:hypothetical protein
MDLNELYYRYKAAEDRLRSAQNFHARVEARADLTHAYYALGRALKVSYRNNRTLRRMAREEGRVENHGYRNNMWEANARRAIKELDNRYKTAMLLAMRGLPNGPQGNILRSVFRG